MARRAFWSTARCTRATFRPLRWSRCGQRPTLASSGQKLPLQRAHATTLAGAVVVVAKQVAEPVHGEAFEFAVQAGMACAAAGGLHRNHDVAEKDPITRRIGFAFELLHVKAQHVG